MFRARSVLLLLLIAALPVPSFGAGSPWAVFPEHQVRLVAPVTAAARGGPLDLGVQFKLARGWHAYWKNPGDSGFPPSFDFAKTTGLADARTLYPAPHFYLETGDLAAFGYSDEVVYPIRAAVTATGDAPLRVHADLNYLLCEKKCIPKQVALDLTLPVADAATVDPEDAKLLSYWLGQVPADEGTLPGVTTRAELFAQGPVLVVTIEGGGTDAKEMALFVEAGDAFILGRAKAERSGGGVRFRVPLTPATEGKLPDPVSFSYTITGVRAAGATIALQATRTVRPMPGAPPAASPVTPTTSEGDAPPMLPLMLLFALLGGLILNAMPCVLPVLSLKVFSVVKSAGQGRGAVVSSNLATAAGIVVSFWALAAAAAFAKTAGAAVGWGVQFQEPAFVSFLAIVVLLFCLNLWGLFEIRLPAWAARVGGSGPSEGVAGHFVSGLFATLLATPCTAPFLGTAVGFALSQGTGTILLLFTALGVGMAMPYLLLAAMPGAARYFPKPGTWMENVRVAMGFLLAATMVWLLYVLAAQVTATGLAWFGVLLVAAAFLVWLLWIAKGRAAVRAVVGIALFATLAAAVAVVSSSRGGECAAPTAAAHDGIPWTPLALDRLDPLAAEGKTVLVNLTAKWCFTCKALEKGVLGDAEVVAAVKARGIVAMQGDWTNRNDAFARYMAGFGRYGVPFTALYAPGRPPVVLPELFTKAAFLEALNSLPPGR
jgi:suppressor for copper-sensitivity B